MNISICIMGHPRRRNPVVAIRQQLVSMPFLRVDCILDELNDEWHTGRRAIRGGIVNESDWHIVIQDDAIISENFYTNLRNALEAVPEKNPVSFYTGKVRPYPRSVRTAVNKAAIANKSWLTSDNLLWGVCVAIPTKDIEPMLEGVKNSKQQYDFRIGSYFKSQKRRIYYTVPSLVDHNDELPSLTGHDRSGEARVAHNYYSGIVDEWNQLTVEI